jgi:pimeloyl-ACP methyl ester carboxylesterase
VATGFHILTWGSDDQAPIICLHAERGHARRFERLARMLRDRMWVVAYDLRGHGRSPWSGDQTLPAHADDLAEVMETCGIAQSAILGDSFGARVALEFAAAHGDRVTALILLDPPLFPLYPTIEELETSTPPAGAFANVDDAIEQIRGEAGLVHTPRALLEEEMAEHLVADEDGRFRLRYSREAAARAAEGLFQSPPKLKEIVCPTLIVRAEGSRTLGAEGAERAAAELRRCRIAVVPGSHAVLWDALAETGALVRDFVTERIRA